MKKFLIVASAAMLLVSCGGKKDAQEQTDADYTGASQEELVTAISDRDQLLVLVNEITDGMEQIKSLENILTVSNGVKGETPAQKEQILADIAAIQQALQDRRERLEELEKKLNSSSLTNSKLTQTIESLKLQIDNQSKEIDNLKGQLADAQTQINTLGQTVDSLNTTVTTVTDQRDQAQQMSQQLTDELNTCYYAIGSKKELKDNKIIESGFLKSTKISESGFDLSFFNKGDKRTLKSIPLHSNKAKVLSRQPASSYSITEQGGQKVLNITNPDEFWKMSNYLVVQID